MNERPLFIVGSARSGTGLLRNMVRVHPRISIPSESHFIPHFFSSYGNPGNASEAMQLARKILTFGRVREWDLSISEDDFRECRSYSQVVSLLFSRWATSEGKPRWGDKTPHYVRHISALTEIFPDAQILHIIRDPRAVSRSWSRHPSGPGNVFSAARQWKENVTAGRNAGAELDPGSYMEIRYEELLKNPEGTMESVFCFLGESIPSDIGSLNLLATAIDYPHEALKGHPNVVEERANAWAHELPRTDIQVIESVAADLMSELGYALTEPVQPLPRIRPIVWRTESYLLHYVNMFKGTKRWKDNGKLLLGKIQRLLVRRNSD